MTTPPDRLERAERITAELREATAAAAGVLKDLTAAAATARTALDHYAYERVTAAVAPLIQGLVASVETAVHDVHVELTREFNETGEQLKALLNDAVTGGNIYRLDMPSVTGVKAVRGLINEAVKRNPS